MDKLNKWEFSLSIKLTLAFSLFAFLLDFLNDLITSGWDFSTIYPEWYTILFSLMILSISLIAQFSTNKLFLFFDELYRKMMDIPLTIQKDTSEIVGKIKSDIEDFKRKLSSGIVEHENFTYRALVYHEDKGEILNAFSGGEQSSRNILFSNKTINLIFSGIKKIDREALKNIGRNSSERFAAELVEDIRSKNYELQRKGAKESIDLLQWIQSWISFDSDAGFGKFYVDNNKEAWKSQMQIMLKYSFLAHDRETEELSICDFMTGYIEGILNHFPRNVLIPYGLEPKKIILTHNTSDPEECICAGREPSEGCVFHINKIN